MCTDVKINKAKRIRAVFFLMAAFIFLFPTVNCNAQEELPFKSGETVAYTLNYTWGGILTDVGSAVCQLSYEDGDYHAVINGYTFKFYDIFFKVRERFETKFSPLTLRPGYFYRSAVEGKYRMKNTFYFNNKNYTIKSITQKYDREPFDTVLQGSPNTFDLLSLYYHSRTLSFGNIPIGQKQPINFVIDKDIYNLYFIYLGKEVKKVPGYGTFRTMKFAVRVVAGNVFTGKDDMTIWVTDDENKLPVFFESPILVGKMQGRVSKIINNKYPLTSKIK